VRCSLSWTVAQSYNLRCRQVSSQSKKTVRWRWAKTRRAPHSLARSGLPPNQRLFGQETALTKKVGLAVWCKRATSAWNPSFSSLHLTCLLLVFFIFSFVPIVNRSLCKSFYFSIWRICGQLIKIFSKRCFFKGRAFKFIKLHTRLIDVTYQVGLSPVICYTIMPADVKGWL